MPNKKGAGGEVQDLATKNYNLGYSQLDDNPLFRHMLSWSRARVIRDKKAPVLCPPDGWAVVTAEGLIYAHPTRRAEPEEWLYVLAHCLLHLGFGHFEPHFQPREWNLACDFFNARFLADLKLGRPPEGMLKPDFSTFSASSEEKLYQYFCENGLPEYLQKISPAGMHASSMIFGPEKESSRWDKQSPKPDWPALFGLGLSDAVREAVNTVSDRVALPGLSAKKNNTVAERARAWFINNYPLLGALAASFELIEDMTVCNRLSVSIAAVDPELKEIYVNPQARLKEPEMRFVLAHELLHVGLRHDLRCQGRDPFLWNAACDYVINGWLIEMGLGELPPHGLLYDPELKGQSAETVYELIVGDLRHFRKLATLRGVELGDILGGHPPEWWLGGAGCDLDDFYRRCLAEGLSYHQGQCRGYLPAGLVEQIRALHQPPIPWDVELAQWFDEFFPPLEAHRTYARLSRRQSATPDIPRPALTSQEEPLPARTFGVILDTSGSMDRNLLAKALGAIASYSVAHEVPAVRVVFCDAAPYDQGYLLPELIADKVRIQGRGGTILQPGIDLLDKAEDFPKDAPLLIITDGECDRLLVRREHAYLLPVGHYLPFSPKGPLFRLK